MVAIACHVLGFLLAVSDSVAPQPSTAGRVVRVGGEASVSRRAAEGGTVLPLRPGDNVEVGDVVRTSDRGTVQLLMQDKSILSLGPKAELHIRDYRVRATLRSRTAVLRVAVGRLWARISKAAGEQRYDLESPTAVAGVRGTSLVMDVAEKGETAVTVLEGSVEVTTPAGEAMVVGGMQRALVAGGDAAQGAGIVVASVSAEEARSLTESVNALAAGGDAQAPPPPGGPTEGTAPAQEPEDSQPPFSTGPGAVDLPPIELDPGAGTTRVEGRVEIRP